MHPQTPATDAPVKIALTDVRKAFGSKQVLRGIKAQAMAARGGASWTAHRQVEREHFVRTWLHDDHWAAADKLLSKGT